MNNAGYHDTRLGFDRRRAILWRTLVQHTLQRYAPTDGSVLELGAGYCDFINAIVAKEKYALDIWPEITKYAAVGVHTIVGDLTRLRDLPDESLNLVFASNLFEHVTREELATCLALAKRKLKVGGRLIALQPNYQYAFANYFDDFTHIVAWSHVSLTDFFRIQGFSIERVEPRFLPLSMKSRWPVHPLLIRAYLASPFKPRGKQMLVVGRRD